MEGGKRIPLENPANDDRRMRSQNINDRIALKLVQTICADDDIIVIAPQIVHSRFEFNHRIDQRSAPAGPVHPAHDPTARKGMLPVPAGKPLEHRQHAIDVEVSISEVGVCGAPHFELTSLCRLARVDSRQRQTLQMITRVIRADDMDGLVANCQSLIDKRQQDAVLLVLVVEKRADMSSVVHHRACQGHRRYWCCHGDLSVRSSSWSVPRQHN